MFAGIYRNENETKKIPSCSKFVNINQIADHFRCICRGIDFFPSIDHDIEISKLPYIRWFPKEAPKFSIKSFANHIFKDSPFPRSSRSSVLL